MTEFFIRQYSNEPVLKLELIDDGKNDKSIFNERLENADITLDLFDVETNEPYLLGSVCNITNRIKKSNFITDEYYIIHKFSTDETSVKGRYEGIINIQFLSVNMEKTELLILPLKEKLFINII